MCCKKNHYICGLIIGSIYTLISLIGFSLSTISLFDVTDNEEEAENRQQTAIESMITTLLAALISALYILAIVKKRHCLIIPWFILSVIIFLHSCLFIFLYIFAAGWMNILEEVLFLILLIGVGIIALQIAIFWFSCSLYKEIRKSNKELVMSDSPSPAAFHNEKF